MTLEIGGFQPLTTLDFPGRLAAVVFCQGCPWRCGYCQNEVLLPLRAASPLDWEQILDFLGRRRGLLDGVVFSGGEPTLQRALPRALAAVRALGFETGLHTAGPYPDRLAAVLPLLDWVGLDIKATAARYGALTGAGRGAGRKALESLDRLLASGVAHEVRTTWHPDLMTADEVLALGEELAERGVADYVLQRCVPGHCLDPALRTGPGDSTLEASVAARLARRFARFTLRGGQDVQEGVDPKDRLS